MAPKPIINFDTVTDIRLSGLFKIGVVSYFSESIGGLSGVHFTATDGTITQTSNQTLNTLRTEFYDVGLYDDGYSTYTDYNNPGFFYSGSPTPCWGYEFTSSTTGFTGPASTITIVATAVPNNSSYSSRSITGIFYKASEVDMPIAWVDSVLGTDATGRGSESTPYKTIGGAMGYTSNQGNVDVGNLQVYLKAGNHDYIGDPAMNWPWSLFQSASGWVDIQPAPGVSRSSVVINSSTAGWTPSNNSIQHLHFKNITFSGRGPFAAIANNQQTSIWLDNCYVKGGETFASNNADCTISNTNFAYFTNTYYTNVMNGPGWGNLTRDCVVENYIQAAYRLIHEGYPINGNKTNALLLNSHAFNQDALGTEAHPDVLHLDFIVPTGRYAENIAVQGCRAYDLANSQGIFAGDQSPKHQDIAFVNVLIQSGNSRMYGAADHMIMRNCQFPSGNWLWEPGYLYAGDRKHWTNSEFTNNIFNTMGMESGSSSSLITAFNDTWDNNLWTHNAFHVPGEYTGLGSSYRTGLIEYNSLESGDYRAYPMLNNCIFAIGYRPTGWNNIGNQIIEHLESQPVVWAYNGAFSPSFPDIGAWYWVANDPRVFTNSLSADCILSPEGCQRGTAKSPGVKGSASTRVLINILRPLSMSLEQYEEQVLTLLNQIITKIISTAR